MGGRRSAITMQLVVGALVAMLPLLSDGTYYVYLALLVLIYSISAIGLNILAGYGGQLSLGNAAFMAIGAYVTALLSKALISLSPGAGNGINILLGVIAGTFGAAICGGVLALPAIRLRGPYLAMVTIAFGWIVWKILVEWVSVTGGDLGLSSVPKVQLGTLVLDLRGLYYVVLLLLLSVLMLQRRLVASQFGMQLRAIKHSEMAVASAGVDVNRVKFVTFVISAAISGFAGALFAHQQSYINPDSFRIFDSVFILLAVLFGGAGTTLGPVVGAAVILILPEMLHGFDKYRLIVYGGLILVTLYWAPKGVVGEALGWARTRLREPPDDQIPATTSTTLEDIARRPGATLRIESVSHSFGGLVALSHVSLQIEKGSIHALIGPNGAGKTTLINIITGVYQAKSGRILIDGVQTRSASLDTAARQGIVRTFQNVKTFGAMTVIEHVLVGLSGQAPIPLWRALLGSRRSREEWSRQRQEARDLLTVVGIRNLEQTPANMLSHGHRRLVEIARALAARPRVLLLDEPAAGLVGDEVRDLASLIQRLKGLGMTIVLVEHNIDLVLGVADKVTVLDHGAVITDGVPNEIRRDERVIAAYLGPSYADA